MPQLSVMSKDLSGGLASAFHEQNLADLTPWNKIGLGFAIAITTIAGTPEHVYKMPKKLHHSGILLGDIFYEYTDSGIFALPRAQLRKGEYNVICNKNVSWTKSDEFTMWLTSAAVQKKFSKENYDKVFNNCLVFTKDVCTFFGIHFPKEFQEFLDWLQKYPWLIRLVGVRSES